MLKYYNSYHCIRPTVQYLKYIHGAWQPLEKTSEMCDMCSSWTMQFHLFSVALVVIKTEGSRFSLMFHRTARCKHRRLPVEQPSVSLAQYRKVLTVHICVGCVFNSQRQGFSKHAKNTLCYSLQCCPSQH